VADGVVNSIHVRGSVRHEQELAIDATSLHHGQC